jgi:4-hydroxy-2-oxoheptanedioate aldolase
VLCTQVNITDTQVAELVARIGFDCLWIDLEHHAMGEAAATQIMRAARAGPTDAMVRIAKGEFMRMARMLDAGAQGIVYPRCESAEEAAELVLWAKFPPLGQRGIYGASPAADYGLTPVADYAAGANDHNWLAVQVESPNAADRAADMAAVDGIDMLFFGPTDYSLAIGRPGEVTGEPVMAALTATCRAARDAGKQFGTLTYDADHARRMLDIGATFLAYSGDESVLRRGFEQMRDTFTPLGFAFDD